MIALPVKSTKREQFIDVTSSLDHVLAESGILNGFVYCYVPHTTAAITINENADPDVPRDILFKLNRLIPQQEGYAHGEGNSDAHVKSSLIGCSLTVPFENGRLLLGIWQGVFFCEFDGPRTRRLMVRVTPSA